MSQVRVAYVTPGDVAEMMRVAERLEKDNPRWMVMFGPYSREFVAFPPVYRSPGHGRYRALPGGPAAEDARGRERGPAWRGRERRTRTLGSVRVRAERGAFR